MYSNQVSEVHFMYGKADGNAALAHRSYQEKYPDRRIVNHGEARCNGRAACQLFEKSFPHHQIPSHTLFAKVYQWASETDTFIANRFDCGALRQQWMGRGGTIAWPARSPDLAPLDYFLWGHMKRLIYETSVESEKTCWRGL
ncbi:hypothetical protein ANN_15509 [Periplaneta americana]|uniref:DUF4817 domain-containing protein n=1 Tax=Periplaneta americana TaxID=6978 RepID=A0ABQ8SHK0_PERAM|nr:hypothetical protein ANN_15509 [Periplaneta americana]